jgi:ABC-type Na+ efflux pump permease subunit
MKWSSAIRQTHRWFSMGFTAAVIANFIVRAKGEPPPWLTYAPLAPLFVLLLTGLYMFVLPYVLGRPGRNFPNREI